jgi:hypothetical protein
MASTFNAAVGAAVAVLFWTAFGLAITRRVVPALALPMAPVIGWAAHSAIALPLFFVLAFLPTHVAMTAGVMLLAAVALWHATEDFDRVESLVGWAKAHRAEQGCWHGLLCAFAHAVRLRPLTAWAKSREVSASCRHSRQATLPTLRRSHTTGTRSPARADAIATTVPPWAYALAALFALAPAAAILPKLSGDAVYLAAPIFDHAKVALMEDIMKFGVPPGNPFFGDTFPRLSYYYLWHFSAAELALAAGISGWEADAAMTWFAAFASLTIMMGLGVWLGGRAAAILVVILSATASARTLLDWMFGSGNVEQVVGRSAGLGGWLFQAAWVPQHIMSAACAAAAVILMSELARRGSALVVVTLALVVTAGFESSTWVGGVTFAIAAPVIAIVIMRRLVPQRRQLFIASLAVAAVLAMCFASPLLRDQLAATAGRGSPVALQFYPVLESYFPQPLRAVLDPPAFWVVLLPLEIPAVYLIGMIALAPLVSSRKFEEDRSGVLRAVAVLALTGLAVGWLLTSTLGENDDLGWRAVLVAAMALTVLAAAGLSRWIGARSCIGVTVAGIAIMLGLPGGIDVMRSYVSGQTEPEARLFAASSQLWAAVRRHAGPAERVGNNPLFLQAMTPWPVNISWALLSGRRSCFAGRELALVYSTLGEQRTEEINAQFIRVFAGDGSPADVQQLATAYHCRLIVVTAVDGAWDRDPFAKSPRYRLVDESAEQWRIYRATEEN